MAKDGHRNGDGAEGKGMAVKIAFSGNASHTVS